MIQILAGSNTTTLEHYVLASPIQIVQTARVIHVSKTTILTRARIELFGHQKTRCSIYVAPLEIRNVRYRELHSVKMNVVSSWRKIVQNDLNILSIFGMFKTGVVSAPHLPFV